MMKFLVECGDGIGRVTNGLRLPLGLGQCNLVEFSSCLLSQALSYIGDVPSSHTISYGYNGLRQPGGVICIKDNMYTEEAFILDVDDASVTRSLPYLLNLTKQAGLNVVFQRMQESFPEDIFPVPMIAFDVDR
eukprot:747270-Ditylum_brightwellii.AAC.1